jgi:hypothetical protein
MRSIPVSTQLAACESGTNAPWLHSSKAAPNPHFKYFILFIEITPYQKIQQNADDG